MRTVSPTAAAVLAALALSASFDASAAGYREVSIAAAHRDAPLEGGVWYPDAGDGAPALIGDRAVFHGAPARRGASMARGAYPLIVLSHGLGGHFQTLGWLATALADAGAVVVAVDHPGGSFRDFDMARAMRHWDRAQDVTAAIDAILIDPIFAAALDGRPVYVAGFSYGGWTALSVAGVRGDLAAYASACARGVAGRHCADMERAGVDVRGLDAEALAASYRDARVQAVAAIDPAFLWGLRPEHVVDVDADLLLIGLGDRETRLVDTDFGPDGADFRALAPEADALTIAEAWHFSALSLCKPLGAAMLAEEGDDPVCDDPDGSDRALVHAAIAAAISAHFELGM